MYITIIIIACILTISAIVYSYCYHDRKGEGAGVPMIALFLAGASIVIGLLIVRTKNAKMSITLSHLEYKRQSSMVQDYSRLTNGIYTVFEVQRSPIGGYLVVLQPASIRSIDFKNGTVDFIHTDHPRMVQSATELAFPGTPGFSGYVEIYSMNSQAHIRDFRPFQQRPEKQ